MSAASVANDLICDLDSDYFHLRTSCLVIFLLGTQLLPSKSNNEAGSLN